MKELFQARRIRILKTNISFFEQLSKCNEELFGEKLCKPRKSIKSIKPKNPDALNKKNNTNENLKGYSGMDDVCTITKAVLPIDYIIREDRLDAPCEMCINRQCPYSQGKIIRF